MPASDVRFVFRTAPTEDVATQAEVKKEMAGSFKVAPVTAQHALFHSLS
jgi:hypothetical protein